MIGPYPADKEKVGIKFDTLTYLIIAVFDKAQYDFVRKFSQQTFPRHVEPGESAGRSERLFQREV